MNILYEFSSALLQARQNKNVTQEQIAFALDISQATYNAWECGHRICPYKHIIALICYFDDNAEDEGIGIRTLLRTKRISYEDIDRIERVDELFGATKTIRLFGMGGVFGYITFSPYKKRVHT